jgi:hypothetical protein
LRAKPGTFLTEDELRRVVPSIFATEPHDSRSNRFVQINSWDILANLQQHGFMAVQATQGNTRDLDRRDFTKHSVRLRHIDDIEGRTTQRRVGDTFFEVKMENASDGTRRYNFWAALLRLICLNGAVVDDGTFAGVHVKHAGERDRIFSEVVEGVQNTLEAAPTVMNAVRQWHGIELNRDERMAFAEQAHFLRFSDSEGKISTPIKPAQLLEPRRFADNGTDLWTTFNVVQENATKGGVSAMGVNSITGRPRRWTTKAINGISEDTKLNKALWALGAKMAEIKQAAS